MPSSVWKTRREWPGNLERVVVVMGRYVGVGDAVTYGRRRLFEGEVIGDDRKWSEVDRWCFAADLVKQAKGEDHAD